MTSVTIIITYRSNFTSASHKENVARITCSFELFTHIESFYHKLGTFFMCSQGVLHSDDIIIFMVIGTFAENVLEAASNRSLLY